MLRRELAADARADRMTLRDHQGVTVSAAQADAFYAEALRAQKVWTVRDASGFPAPANRDGHRAQPFWSRRSRAEHVIESVHAYAVMEVVEIEIDVWRSRWLPGMARDGLLVGLNWSGERATGFDLQPAEVERNLSVRDSPPNA